MNIMEDMMALPSLASAACIAVAIAAAARASDARSFFFNLVHIIMLLLLLEPLLQHAAAAAAGQQAVAARPPPPPPRRRRRQTARARDATGSLVSTHLPRAQRAHTLTARIHTGRTTPVTASGRARLGWPSRISCGKGVCGREERAARRPQSRVRW